MLRTLDPELHQRPAQPLGPSPGICHAILVRPRTWRATPSTSPGTLHPSRSSYPPGSPPSLIHNRKLCVAVAWCIADLQMQLGTWIETLFGSMFARQPATSEAAHLRTYPRIDPADTIENKIPLLTRSKQLETSSEKSNTWLLSRSLPSSRS
ncbi:hypothetical protein CSIM01_12735 [Colletotrichum simmondsii]|uniref:Uncharacterized protein n=1 Tax=Colletotrichum simmondsii TaxID=703756 RepID=A0A135TBQ2_9PEZI|nr:hypothetical protein CSIM01_12735 [Colletotrichum simmondsii]